MLYSLVRISYGSVRIIIINIIIIYYAPPVRKGALSIAFVRPFVRPSVRQYVAYVANNSRTQRPSVPKIRSERRFSTFDATRIPVSRSKGQRSRSPGPLILTHIVHHLFRTARLTNFKLGTRMVDDDSHDSHQPQVT